MRAMFAKRLVIALGAVLTAALSAGVLHAQSETASVTVTPSPTTISANTALSVVVAVTATSGSDVPTGTITIASGGYTSASQTLASGSTTFSIPANSLSQGTDTLTASYSGDSNFPATTGTANETVTASTGTFTLAATAAGSVSKGSSGTSTITANTTNNYAGTVTLTCALTTSPSGAVNLPACTLSPTSMALSTSATSGTATATVTTTSATSTTTQLVPHHPNGRSGALAASAALAFLISFGISSARRKWLTMLGALLLTVALGGLIACGDFWQAPSGNTASGTTSGAYTFTVTGVGSPATTNVTTTFTLTVN